MTAQAKKTNKELEHLGRMLVSIYETGYIDHNQQYKASFLKGLVSGLGGAIGATIVFAVVLWVLSLFTSVPLVGRFVDNVTRTIETKQLQ